MFCKNCGTELKTGSTFCGKCGTKLVTDHEKQHPEISGAEQKAWYRLFKVLYILLFVGSLGFVLIVAYSAMPQRILDGNLSTIQCDNGKNYAPENNDIYIYGDTLSYYQDQNARILCAYDTLNFYRYTAPSYKNYTFIPTYTEPDYSSWLFYTAVALLACWIILKFLRVGMNYILLGGKPNWRKEFRKFY